MFQVHISYQWMCIPLPFPFFVRPSIRIIIVDQLHVVALMKQQFLPYMNQTFGGVSPRNALY